MQVENEPTSVLIAREIRLAHVFCVSLTKIRLSRLSHYRIYSIITSAILCRQLGGRSYGNFLNVSRLFINFLHEFIKSLSTFRLNEGFASFYELILVDNRHTEVDLRINFVTENRDPLMSTDVHGQLVPLNQYVETPAEIEFKTYDVIVTHDKAAHYLRMIMFMLTQPTFEKGVRYYLAERAYQSATPSDLHAGLQRALDEDIPTNNINVASMMSSWEDFAGYPVVTASREADRLILTQENFNTRYYNTFSVPINYATATNPDFLQVNLQLLLTTREAVIFQGNATKSWSDGDWIVLNLRQYGYYATNYDNLGWDLIIAALLNNIDSIDFESRSLFFADFRLFLEQGHDVSTTILLRLLSTLQIDNVFTVWNRASNALSVVTGRLRETTLLNQHLSFVRNLMQPIYNRMVNDASFNSELSGLVTFWSCLSGIQECLSATIEEVTDVMMTGETSTPNMCSGFRSANDTVWKYFWYVTLQSSGVVREQLLTALPCTNDPALLTYYLNQVTNLGNGFTREQRAIMINRVYNANFVGYNFVFDFVAAHHEFIHTQ